MGYATPLMLISKVTADFQFPLWDTWVEETPKRTPYYEALSIPFMGYIDPPILLGFLMGIGFLSIPFMGYQK